MQSVQSIPLAPHQLRDALTRTEDTFVICHLGVPRIEPREWSLELEGLCARPQRLSHAALLAYPKVEVTSVHERCGSPLAPFEPARRVSNVRWGGSHVLVRSSDGDWCPAELESASGRGWQRFSVPWTARHRGPVLLASRAIARSGARQPLAGRRNAVHGVPLMVA